jgi:hypothetical protein
MQLPDSAEVNAATLSRLFDNVTNSYKFLFFLALLESMERSQFRSEEWYATDAIVLDMLVLAWYPHVYFRLSFGKQDKVALALDQSAVARNDESIKPWDKDTIRKLLASNRSPRAILSRYVPFRLIRTFFPETRGLKDTAVNGRVADLAEQYFVDRKPLYRFDVHGEKVQVHPAWCDYLQRNLAVVRGWAWWNFLQYMQHCNPNVPAVSSKLFAPAQRESMTAQTNYWKAVLTAGNIHCIYSGEPISVGQFALDHFVPWSFVVHNQLWNLVPTLPSINSRKSDRLPALQYFDAFVTTQHSALIAARDVLNVKAWEDQMSPFLLDFGLSSFSDLLDKNRLAVAYEGTVLPLLRLAEANGFEGSWIHQ